ncbi:MAG: TonB-dependent receptor family protein, partial [Bacteroidia bacterium]
NWFQVNWILAAWQVQYRPDSNNLIEMRLFGLLANRGSLGNLERINRVDLGGNRNLIQGDFANIGQELRWLRTFRWFGNTQFNLLGYRIYSGHSKAKQGVGTDGSGADFIFLHPNDLENSDYRFNNTNLALFWEQVLQVSTRLTLSPGIRAEYIQTAASGYYKLRVFDAAGNLVVDEKIEDSRVRDRHFVIAGIGSQYKLNSKMELYANVSQNYRAINYTDLRISNPGFRVDSNLRDEHGFTADLGIRGEKAGYFIYELTGFYLKYNGRIGQVLRSGEAPLYLDYRFRTNIADSRTFGVEAMGELNLFRMYKTRRLRFQDLNLFVNLAVTDARYLAPEQKAIDQKQVEMVPRMLIRSGLRYRWKYFRSSLNYSYTASHFSDATNSEWTSSAVEGRIPAYAVVDFSAGWKKGKWSVDFSLNNVLNSKYFTRRADSYPGPGIIPAEARAVYLTLGLQVGK